MQRPRGGLGGAGLGETDVVEPLEAETRESPLVEAVDHADVTGLVTPDEPGPLVGPDVDVTLDLDAKTAGRLVRDPHGILDLLPAQLRFLLVERDRHSQGAALFVVIHIGFVPRVRAAAIARQLESA